MNKTALIIEGGAFRGLYAGGVLDALMAENIYFDTVVGVSAGILCATSYVSRQPGRTREANLALRHDSRYVGLEAVRNSGGIIDVEFGFRDPEILERFPFDRERFYASDTKVYAVATNCQTGKAEYFEHNECDFIQAMRASTGLPIMQPMVSFNGGQYMDGGIADSVPVDWAVERGYEKIVVILTRPLYFQKKPVSRAMLTLCNRRYRAYPELIKAIATQHEQYNAARIRLARYKREGRIFLLQPSHMMSISRLEGDIEKLDAWMQLGEDDTRRSMPELKKYLEL